MLSFETRGRVGLITLQRPEVRNAINREITVAMESAIDEIESNDEIWAGVIAGDGPVFSAGADLKVLSAGRRDELQTERGGFAGLVRRARRKPLIAAVEGPALAGGFEIVLACDLVVASSTASFSLPEVKRSLVAAAGGLFRLPRMLPRNVALELLITAEVLGAERAFALGLVNLLTEPGRARESAWEMAEAITENAPLAVQRSRAFMLDSLSGVVTDEELWEQSHHAMEEMLASEDGKEGPRAFIEKRRPVWSGR
jgi:enoyl-CoA hydratase